MLTPKQLSQLYTPTGPKLIQGGISWTSGGKQQVGAQIDLSTPIFGFRVVLKGRLVIGTANFTSVGPEGFLNAISRILIQGTNRRQGGQVTLWDIDMATAWVVGHFWEVRANQFDLGASELAVPSTPFPSTYAAVAQATYDFRIVLDLPAFPYGSPMGVRPGFLIRSEEFGDSLTMAFEFGAQAGNSTGFLGVAAASTTVTFTSFGSGAGTPSIDVYSVPANMGLDLKDKVLPGLVTRVTQPINTILQAAGGNMALANLQKMPTSRVILKVGTSAVGAAIPAFATLSDTNVSQLGITLGGNRSVRNKVDVFAHKQDQVVAGHRDPIQGYNLLDFMQSGLPLSAYPANKLDIGSSFQLVGDVAGVANAYGLVIQEQIPYMPSGELYSG